jgi:C-terminal processing protease CtpA/Prc
MLAQFAKENNLATIIGTKTPGRLTSRSAFKIGHDYRLVLRWSGEAHARRTQSRARRLEPDHH